MQIIYYENYSKKKSKNRYSNVRNELENIEEKLREKEEIEDGYFYQNISNYRKIKRFGDHLGGYRLAIFIYDNCCLFVDFEIKKEIIKKSITSESLFQNDNKHYIDYINRYKKKVTKKLIDLNYYKNLINFSDNVIYEEICLESIEFNQQLIRDKRNLIKIFNLLKNNILELYNKNYTSYKTIYRIEENSLEIYYKILIQNDINIIFLIGFSDKTDLKEIDEISSISDLLKKAIKSYPLEIFLEEFDKWNEYIVKNNDGNIALSPEEEEILRNMQSYNSDAKYPFFINGRAGSGKSTILQYLFADYIVKFLSLKKDNKNLEYEPLYLTYNDKLKEKAIERVCSIILAKTQKDIKERLNLNNKNRIEKEIEEFFKSFDTKDGYNFIEELLYLNKKNNIFKDKKKVDFEYLKDYFKQLIERKGKRFKNFTPELIWYVIRSYIKGRGVIDDDKLKPLSIEEYKRLSKNLKLIDENIFKTIYNEFYNTYKRYLDDNNLYDDLDLVFEIYREKAFNKKYSIIFCDETQDFTKVEFDFILNLNIFLSDNIKFDDFKAENIPIVFAGDPFQTINPTGFNFNYLKALVYESYKNRNKKIKLNFKDLKLNYRSNSEIIKFSNLIQLLRGVIFRDKNITLQTQWSDNLSDKYSILLFSDSIEKEDYYQFIFPTKTREIYKNDKIFKRLDIDRLDMPIDVKGLEYHTIVLYRLGDFYLKNYKNIKKIIYNGFKNKESSLPYEYFFNNFYVAITRAKNRIIIIDSEDAKKEFWDNIAIDLLYNRYKKLNKDIEKDNLLTYKDGKNSDLKLDNEDREILIKNKLQIDIFERYDDEKDKTTLLNEIEKVLNRQKINQIYFDILRGLKAENNQNYLETIDYLMRVVVKAENRELSKSNISYLIKKSFENLLKSIRLEDNRTLVFLKKYENQFIELGFKYENRVKLLKYFLYKEYSKTLDYFKDEFDIKDKNEIFNYILLKSLDRIEIYKLSDYIIELYNRDYISDKDIKDIISNRLEDKSNYKYLIKIFDIEEIKKQYRDIYHRINLELNSKDIDSLIYNKKLDRLVELIKNNEIKNYQIYYKQILYYLSKKNIIGKIDILDKLDIKLIVDNYLKYYNEFDLIIWKYIVNSIFNDIKNSDYYISRLMKFFEGKHEDTKLKHIEVIIKVLKQQEEPILNRLLFNTFINIFSNISNRIEIYDIAFSLEKTLSFYNRDNIEKILDFYNSYLDNREKKYKDFIASRFIKIKYELDGLGKERFNNRGDYTQLDDAWLSFIKENIGYSEVKSNKETISKIPLRIEDELAQKIYKIEDVDEIYKMTIDYYDSKYDYQRNKKVEQINIINILDIVDILDTIQDFIEDYKDWDRKTLRDISNRLSGIKEDIEKIRENVKK